MYVYIYMSLNKSLLLMMFDMQKKKFLITQEYRCADVHDAWNPAGIYMFKVDNRNSRTRCEICSKLTIKTPERRQ